jgi:hypothetical protein
MDLVEVLVEEHGDLQDGPRDPESGEPQAPVSLQAEQRAQSFLAAQRRRQLDEEVRHLVPGVPEPVRRARRNHDCVAGTERPPPPSEPEAKRSRDTLEALELSAVNVHRHESAGPDEQLPGHAIAGQPAEHDPLPTHRILDRIDGVEFGRGRGDEVEDRRDGVHGEGHSGSCSRCVGS